MCLTLGSVLVCSPSRHSDGPTKIVKISSNSSRILFLRLDTISCSFGLHGWLWCHFGSQINFPLKKCYSIQWWPIQKATRCPNLEEMWLTLLRSSKELLFRIWLPKLHQAICPRANKTRLLRKLRFPSPKACPNVDLMPWDLVYWPTWCRAEVLTWI